MCVSCSFTLQSVSISVWVVKGNPVLSFLLVYAAGGHQESNRCMCEPGLSLTHTLSLILSLARSSAACVPEKGGSDLEQRVRRAEEGYGGSAGAQTVL